MKILIVVLGAASLSVAGCSPLVLDPIEGAGAGAPSGGTTGTGIAAGSPSIAMRYRDWKLPHDPSGRFNTGFLGAPSIDPDSLVLFFSDAGQACSAPILFPAPTATDCSGQTFQQLALVIPPELDRPGVIDLRDHRVLFYEGLVVDASCGGGSGYGMGYEGTLEIVSSSASSISVELHTGVTEGGPVLDGHYDAAFCGPAPTTAPPTAGVAMLGANLPPGSSVGGTIDPAALYVFAGSATSTCADLEPAVACTGTWRTTLAIPAALQVPGTVDLGDVDAAYVESRESDSSCGADDMVHGLLKQGTATISDIDATSFAMKVQGSFVEENGFDVDGAYAISICP